MKKAVIYTRSATVNSHAIQKQEERCQQFARQSDYEVVRVFTDNGYPGTNTHRPAFRELIDSRKRKNWDIVIVADSSRFFRKPRGFTKYLKVLLRAGKQLVSARNDVGELYISNCFHFFEE